MTRTTRPSNTYEFKEKLYRVNQNIIVEGEYVNNKSKIAVKCAICDNQWEATPSNLLRGKGCPKCGKMTSDFKRTKTHETFVEEMKALNPTIQIDGEYRGAFKDIVVTCTKCGHQWAAKPHDLLQRRGCCKCSGLYRKTAEEFKEDLLKICPTIRAVGEYINSHTPLEFECLRCGKHWYARPTNILNSHTGCPHCKSSKGEQKIASFLGNSNIPYVAQKKFDDLYGTSTTKRCHLSYDFYLPEQNILIEYQGEYHDGTAGNQTKEAFLKQQEHDLKKKQYAEEHGIPLLVIWYWDFFNVEIILHEYLDMYNKIP